jgi:hypothetical protein
MRLLKGSAADTEVWRWVDGIVVGWSAKATQKRASRELAGLVTTSRLLGSERSRRVLHLSQPGRHGPRIKPNAAANAK